PRAEACPPGLTDIGEQCWCDHLLTMRACIGFYGLDHHTPGKGWNGFEALSCHLFPAQFLSDLKTKRLRRRQIDNGATILARLVGAGGLLGQIVPVSSIGTAAAAPADLAELTGAAAPAELRLAQIVKHSSLFPEPGERGLAQIPSAHRHVGTGRNLPFRRDAAIIFAGRTRAVRIIFE